MVNLDAVCERAEQYRMYSFIKSYGGQWDTEVSITEEPKDLSLGDFLLAMPKDLTGSKVKSLAQAVICVDRKNLSPKVVEIARSIRRWEYFGRLDLAMRVKIIAVSSFSFGEPRWSRLSNIFQSSLVETVKSVGHVVREVIFTRPSLEQLESEEMEAVLPRYEAYVLKKVKKHPEVFIHARKVLGHNKAFMIEVMQRQGMALGLLGDESQDDDEVVMAAVQQCGAALQYASRRLKNKEKVVLAAEPTYPSSFIWASDRLREKESFVSQAILIAGRDAMEVMECVSPRVQKLVRHTSHFSNFCYGIIEFNRWCENMRSHGEM